MPQIKIEDKHTYLNYSFNLGGNNRFSSIPSPTDVFTTHTPTFPVQGTDENNRIGRKIHTLSLHHEGYIMLPISSGEDNGTEPSLWNRFTIMDGWNGYEQDLNARLRADNYEFPSAKTMFSIPIRHLWVKFYDEEFQKGTTAEKAVYLGNWFKALTIQIGTDVNAIPSIQTKTLRESTSFTGDFKIVKDEMFWLSPDKPIIHFNETIPLKKTLSFDAQGSDPTNYNLYSLWIGPMQPQQDYFNYGFGQWMNNSTLNPNQPYIVATIRGNIKMKYTDF